MPKKGGKGGGGGKGKGGKKVGARPPALQRLRCSRRPPARLPRDQRGSTLSRKVPAASSRPPGPVSTFEDQLPPSAIILHTDVHVLSV